MRQVFSSLLLIAVFASCKDQPVTKTETVTNVLTEQTMLTKNVVLAGYNKHPDSKAANDLFMKGVDIYRNQRNPDAAISLFTRSILAAPTPKAYYELGNASMDTKQYAKAIQCYDIAEALGFEPVNRVYYNIACANSMLGKKDEAVDYLKYAIQAGYSNSDQILNDPDLVDARKSDVFQTAYNDALSGSSDPDELEFQNFKRGFKVIELPIVIDRSTKPNTTEDGSYISYDYERFVPEMKGSRFSRDVGSSYFYYASVSGNANYSALIYATRDEIYDQDHSPVGFTLVCFDPKGNMIDKLQLGGRFGMEDPFMMATISKSLQIELKSYKDKYQKDPETEGYSDNKVVSSSLQNTRHYHITDDGKIVRDNGIIGMR